MAFTERAESHFILQGATLPKIRCLVRGGGSAKEPPPPEFEETVEWTEREKDNLLLLNSPYTLSVFNFLPRLLKYIHYTTLLVV